MSSILDALKKSERQRSLGRDLVFRNASPNATPRLTGFAIAVLVTLLLLALAIGALLFSLREPVPPPQAIPSAEAPTPSTGSATDAQPADATTASVTQSAERSETVPARDRPAQVRNQTIPLSEKSAGNKKPAAVDAPGVTADARPATGAGAVPWLSSLPQAFRSSLPPLAVNIHVYSPDQSQRILYINNRQARQGERIEGGVVVEEIVHDGVVLQYRGQRFRLPRPR